LTATWYEEKKSGLVLNAQPQRRGDKFRVISIWLTEPKASVALRFLYAFAKYVRANISDKEKETLSLVAEAFVSTTAAPVNLNFKEGSIVEV
jgi:hypothetical protein